MFLNLSRVPSGALERQKKVHLPEIFFPLLPWLSDGSVLTAVL